MFKKFSLLYCLCSIATINSALALDLQEALSSAYHNNIEFARLRSEFLNDTEGLLKNTALRFVPSVRLIIGSEYNRSNSPFRRQNENLVMYDDQDWFESKAAMQFRYDIFNNGQDLLEIKREKVKLKGAISKFLKNEQKSILQCIVVYLDYLVALQESEIAESMFKESQQMLEIAQKRHEIGHIDEIEILHMTSDSSYTELEYMASLSNLQAARTKFITTFSIEPDNIQMPTPDTSDIDLAESIIFDISMNNNPELAEARYTSVEAREVLRRSQWRFLPTISVGLDLGHNTYNGSFFKDFIHTVGNKGNYLEKQYYDAKFSVNMILDIFSRNDRMQELLKARKSVRLASVSYEYQVDRLKSQVLELIKNIRNAREYMQHSKIIIERQKSIIEASIEQYNMGKERVDITFVLRQKQNLHKSFKRNLEYTIQYLKNIYHLKLITGQLTANKLNLHVESRQQNNKRSNLTRKNNFSS